MKFLAKLYTLFGLTWLFIFINNAFPDDVEIVLPKTNVVYKDDTANIHIAIPLYGCGGGEFPVKNWQGLFVYGKSSTFLEDIEFEVLNLHNFNGPDRRLIRFAGMQGKKCEDTGKCPIFFIANLKQIINTNVQVQPSTSYLDRFGNKTFNEKTINVGKLNYVLSIQSKGKDLYGWQRIILRLDTISQILYEKDMGLPSTLMWAGDINQDNKLDLLFRRPAAEGSVSVELWLSSKGSTPLVKMAASFGYRGCH